MTNDDKWIVMYDPTEHHIEDAIMDHYQEHIVMKKPLSIFDLVLQKKNSNGDWVCVGIERKHISDYRSSCMSRHMQDQAIRMRKYNHAYTIVYGDYSEVEGYFPPEQFMGNMCSLTNRYRVPTFWVRDLDWFFITADTLLLQAEKVNEPIEPPIVKRNTNNEKINVLTGIYGIGEKTAEDLLETFGSVKSIFNATKSELLNVKGIGEKTVKQIMDAIT